MVHLTPMQRHCGRALLWLVWHFGCRDLDELKEVLADWCEGCRLDLLARALAATQETERRME